MLQGCQIHKKTIIIISPKTEQKMFNEERPKDKNSGFGGEASRSDSKSDSESRFRLDA
jgi:hypothetical protein